MNPTNSQSHNDDNNDQNNGPREKKIYENITNEKRSSLVRMVMEQSVSLKDASNVLQVNYSSARSILRSFKTTGDIHRKLKGGSLRRVCTADVIDKIESIVSENPGYTLKEIKICLEMEIGKEYTISLSSIDKCLNELGVTLKKAHRELNVVNSQGKIQQRKDYSLWFNNYFSVDYSKIVFADESSFNLHLQRTYARSRVGTRANVTIPTVRTRSISLISSISHTRICFSKVISVTTVNADVFSEYLKELCDFLRNELNMQQVCIILNNVRVHKKENIARITEEYGFEFKFLSPYSYA